MKSPAPTSNVRETATCVTTSARPQPNLRLPQLTPPSFSDGVGSSRVARHAGAKPKTTAAMIETSAVKATMRRSRGALIETGAPALKLFCPPENTDSSKLLDQEASSNPTAPPRSEEHTSELQSRLHL